jgi:DNA invertase Pin-like site-specific DNA recombinase
MLGVAVKLERRRIAERTARRQADAKPKGVKFGRKPTLTPHRQREARERLGAGETQRSVPAATMLAKGRFRDCDDEALHQLYLVSGATPTYPSFKRSRTVSLSEFA